MNLFSNLVVNSRRSFRSRIFGLALVAVAGVSFAVAVGAPGQVSHSRTVRPLQQASAKKSSGTAPNPGGGKNKKGSPGTGATTPTVTPLSYYGGAVFSSPYTVHDIYWIPSGFNVASGYQSVIDGFAQNLAAASGSTTNVFDAATQYTDSAGNHVVNSANFGGSATITTPFPASGCTDSAVKNGPCLTDVQAATEIRAVAASQGWSVSYPNVYALMMPTGVGNCATTSTGSSEGYCSFQPACAWHHQWGSLYFIVMGDPATGGCETGESPNGNPDADSAINMYSHELNETLTDPAGESWYDASGNEMADKCEEDFGSPLGGAAGQEYNQVINGAHYYLQGEWSNASSSCVFQGT